MFPECVSVKTRGRPLTSLGESPTVFVNLRRFLRDASYIFLGGGTTQKFKTDKDVREKLTGGNLISCYNNLLKVRIAPTQSKQHTHSQACIHTLALGHAHTHAQLSDSTAVSLYPRLLWFGSPGLCVWSIKGSEQ